MGREHAAGKGDSPRNVDRKKYGDNLEKIFGKKPLPKRWNPDDEEEEKETKRPKTGK